MIEIEDFNWDSLNASAAGQYLDFQERSIIYEFLDNYTPRLCLDIACGSGRFSLSFAERGICVVAGDRDPVPIKTNHILQIDAEHPLFQDKAFDCVLSIQTFSYTDAQQFIFERDRILH